MRKLLIITTNYAGCECSTPDCNCIRETGVYLEEFAVPFLVFEKSNIEMVVASPLGGVSPVDESSMSCSNPEEWDKCIKILRNTKRLGSVDYKSFNGIYFPGGHGPMFDLAQSDEVAKIVEHFSSKGKLISAICHGVCALVKAKRDDDSPIVSDRRLTSFTDEEERIAKKEELVPFLLETRLRELGADFVAAKPWLEHVEVDRNLITGQNQNSALLLAEKMLENEWW